MKTYEIDYSGTGAFSFIKATTTISEESITKAKEYFKKFYPTAKIVKIREIK